MKGKKKASATAYDSEEPTEQEMSVGNMCHGCLLTNMIAQYQRATISFVLAVVLIFTTKKLN